MNFFFLNLLNNLSWISGNISYYWSSILIVIVNYQILFKLTYLFKLRFMDFKGDQFSSVQ